MKSPLFAIWKLMIPAVLTSVTCGLGLPPLAQAQQQSPGYAVQRVAYHTPAATYFGARPQSAYRQSSSPQQAAAPSQLPQLNGHKPFQNIHRGPVVSPYMSLDIPESATGLPNYYAFVQPQLEQRATNEAQADEIRRLRQQVRRSGRPEQVSKSSNAGLPTTGNSSQFMNLGNYFPGSR